MITVPFRIESNLSRNLETLNATFDREVFLKLLLGDCLEQLKTIESESVQTCITSPPYWGLRDYGNPDQLGQEQTPEEFVLKLVRVFSEVRRVLRNDGTLWLNLGDSYSAGGRGKGSDFTGKQKTNVGSHFQSHLEKSGSLGRKWSKPPPGLKRKELVGIPWRVAFALQADGWYLRQDIIWNKPNPMPESITDRCTKSHEYIFLLSKSPRYFFDHEAIKEKAVGGKPAGNKPSSRMNKGRLQKEGWSFDPARSVPEYRNRRSVWTVTTKPFRGAHFATFPIDLISPCVLAGSRKGGVILDPFAGAGTVGVACKIHEREFIGIELNPEYRDLAIKRINEFSDREKRISRKPQSKCFEQLEMEA